MEPKKDLRRPGSLQVREIDAFGRCTIPMWNVRDRGRLGKSCGSGGFFMGKGSVNGGFDGKISNHWVIFQPCLIEGD